MYEKIKICVDCGEEFIAKSPNQARCTDCRIIYKREYMRQYSRERQAREREAIIAERKKMGLPAKQKPGRKPKRKPKPVKKKDDSNICKKIKICEYGGHMGAERICDYLCKTGRRRPCKAGECTVYKKRQGRRKNVLTLDLN